MPPRKIYPPASRQSARRNNNNNDPTPSTDSTVKQEGPADKKSPEISDNTLIESDSLLKMADLAALTATITTLQHEVAQLRANGSNDNASQREATPDNSAFGSANFEPVGLAARKAFKPYGEDQAAKNPAYDRKAKATARDPSKFSGNKNEFDYWITRLADKFMKDDETFKTERSRMALINGLVTGAANNLIRSQYESETHPYCNAAEMVQVLATIYHNVNQGSIAHAKLAQMMYEPGGRLDIHQYITEVNSLADLASIPDTECKTIL